MAIQKKPATIIRSGNIKATIWENEGLQRAFYSTTFSRPYKDARGIWKNAHNFGLYELESLMNAALEAKEWLAAHTPKA